MDKAKLEKLLELARARRLRLENERLEGVLPSHLTPSDTYKDRFWGISNELVRWSRICYFLSCLVEGVDCVMLGISMYKTPNRFKKLLLPSTNFPYQGPIPAKWKQKYLEHPEKYLSKSKKRRQRRASRS